MMVIFRGRNSLAPESLGKGVHARPDDFGYNIPLGGQAADIFLHVSET